jgi:hypothetical protein
VPLVESAAVAVIVGAAGLYVGSRAWRLFRPAGGAGGAGGGCGCAGKKAGCAAADDVARKIRAAAARAPAPSRGIH